MTCAAPSDQRSHNSGSTGPSQTQPGTSGLVNGRVTSLLNMQSTEQPHDLQSGPLSNLRNMMAGPHGPVHPGPGLAGQNLNNYNQNTFLQQYPQLVN